jgi:RHS repeat-associated protein
VKASNRTYGQFRGYGEVDTRFGNTANTTNGAADAQTESKAFYYRGMNGDTLPGGGTRTANVSDTFGATISDNNAFADQQLETQKLNGVGGAEVSATVTNLAVAATTATQTVSGLPTVYATMVRTASQRTVTDLAAGGTEFKQTATTYDASGRPILADTTGTGIAETCQQTSYAANSSGTITNATAESITAQQACPASAGNLTASAILSDTRTYYDGSTTLGQITGPGDPTTVSKAVTNTNGALTFVTQSTTSYDAMGRVTAVTDARGNATKTSYTPADGGPLTQKTVTNAKNQGSTQTIDPGRGTTQSSTDVAGYLTTATYDPLGRTTAVWKPGRSQTGGAAANSTYSYQVSQTAPLAVTTNTLVDTGSSTGYVTSVSLYDSLGQLRQTQVQSEGGNTAVTDKSYDSHGWVWQTSNNYVVSGSPSTTLATVTTSAANDRTVTTFDADGRAVLAQAFNGATLTSSTQTIYSGDSVTTIEHDPAGTVIGTPQTTASDVEGRTTATEQYSAPPTVSGNVVTAQTGTLKSATTSYDAAGNKAKYTDPNGNTWSYSYDLLGNQVKAVDPDTGTMTTSYDAEGNVASTTDANGTTDNYVYDVLNRKTAEYTGSATQGSGTKIATWVWDTLKNGKQSYETSIDPTTGVVWEDGTLGYDGYGTPTGTWVVAPSSATGLSGTWKTTDTYSSTGQMLTLNPANGGGLPVDALTFSYDQYGNPIGEKGYDTYVSGASYTPFGEISQLVLGSGPSAASLTYTYDAQTRNKTGVSLSDTAPSPQVDSTTYSYNAAGQMTSTADTEGASGSAPVETQCYTYDLLNRLTAAWSATDQCAANPFVAGSNATVGGPQPYAQSWTFDNAGDRKSETDLAPAGSSAGTTTSTYTYGVSAHAHAIGSVASTNSVTGNGSPATYKYDNDGNMTQRGSSGETLTWDANGKLASDTNANGVTSFVYDADGNELLENAPGSSTLFLPGEQITYDTTSKTTSGVRYYVFNGVTIAESTSSNLYWLEGNPQSTMNVAVNAFAQSSVTRRAFTPYGSVAAGSSTWIDNRSFLGDVQQSATGLVDIGARKYDPVLGSFISVDPKLSTANPQSMTGYTYAGDNPVGSSDPSGKMALIDGAGIGYWISQNTSCNNPTCTTASRVTTAVGVGTGSVVTAKNVNNLYYLHRMNRFLRAEEDTTSTWNYYSADEAPPPPMTHTIGSNLSDDMRESYVDRNAREFANVPETGTVLNLSRYTKPGLGNALGVGSAVVGTGLSTWSEWDTSHHNVKNTILVGVGDTAVNGTALVAGDAAAAFTTSLILGTEVGASLGPLGAVGGMAVGAIVGGFISLGGSELVGNIVNHPMQTIKSIASDLNPFNW